MHLKGMIQCKVAMPGKFIFTKAGQVWWKTLANRYGWFSLDWKIIHTPNFLAIQSECSLCEGLQLESSYSVVTYHISGVMTLFQTTLEILQLASMTNS